MMDSYFQAIRRLMPQGQFFRFRPFSLGFMLVFLSGCQGSTALKPDDPRLKSASIDSNDFLIVDCLLPGQIRRLGSQLTYVSARQAVRTSGADCQIRGGEYVAFDRANYATALKIWLPLAQNGDAEAQTNVGEIFERGLGLEPDYAAAAEWYKKAAIQGLTRAQINLGHLYEKGLGVPQDKKKALDFYRVASGIKNDKILYESTLSATYVPRESYEALQKDLEENKRKNRALQNELKKKNSQLKRTNQKQKKDLSRLQKSLRKAQQINSSIVLTPEIKQKEQNSPLTRTLQKQVAELQQEKGQLRSQLSTLKSQSNLTRRDLEATRQQLELSKQEVKQVREEQAQNRTDADQLDSQVKRSETEISRLKAEIRDQRKLIQNSDTEQKLAELERQLILKQKEYKAKQSDLSNLQLLNRQLEQQLAESKLRIQQQEILAKQQQDSSISEAAKLKFLLDDKAKRIKAIEEQLLMNSATMAMAKNNYLEQVEAITLENQKKLEASRKEIETLSRSLNDSRNARFEQEQKIAELRWEIESVSEQTKIISSAPVEETNLDISQVPSIEIIDPPVVLTRSVPTVELRKRLDTKEIIGKVDAPAGLLLFSVNGEKTALATNTLFRVKVPLQKDTTPVDIVAVDQGGRRVAVNFTIQNAQNGSQSGTESQSRSVLKAGSAQFGKYYALIIGNNNYSNLSTLKTAVTDARETEKLLRKRYGYRTKLLVNANRYQILSALNELREKLTEEDNLLIYYAGHGQLDPANNRSYWLPVDAEQANSANWISSTAITDMLNAMQAKHVIVVADSCYAGNLSQASVARSGSQLSPSEREEWVDIMSATRARVMLTSGGVQPVLDGGGGKHSVFAKAFLKALRDNDGLLEGFSLYSQVLGNLEGQTTALGEPQVPQYSPIHMAGHEAGEFFFNRVL